MVLFLPRALKRKQYVHILPPTNGSVFCMHKNKTVMPVYPIVSCSANDRSCQVKGKQNILQMMFNVIAADFNSFKFNALSCSIQAVYFHTLLTAPILRLFIKFVLSLIKNNLLIVVFVTVLKDYKVTAVFHSTCLLWGRIW